MTAQVIQRDKLGVLTKIGQGGQGVVYGAPNVKTKFAASMVYKEYKAQTLTEIDFNALGAMPALVEDSLSYAQAERLISLAAWPCAIVEDAGAPTGFVMPAIPEEFFVALTTVKGVSRSTAEFQHLLNHETVLAARGIDIEDAQRYSLLREAASGLAFLHKHGVCVGDISPKNLLFSLKPHEAVYFIDCDATRINGVSALPQVETPGWNLPPGEELATVYSDTYKLGLLALRLLVGDHDTPNPQHLPATTPNLLRQIITDTLGNEAERRPLPEAWTYVLGHAIEQAQHQKRVAPPVSVPLDAPPIPVVRSRPTAHSAPPVRPSAPPPPASVPPASVPPVSVPPSGIAPASQPPASQAKAWAGVAAAFLLVALVVAMVNLTSKNDHASSSAYQTPTTTSQSSSTTTTIESTTSTTTSTSPVDLNLSNLLSRVSSGYSSGTCTSTTPGANGPFAAALATVSCQQNTLQGGPSHATYGLFGDISALKSAFNRDIGPTQLVTCPDSAPSPASWHHDSSPSVAVGMIACAVYQGKPNVMWTNEDTLVLADTFSDGPVADLFQWWRNHG